MALWVDELMDWGTTVAERNPATAGAIRRYSGGGRQWCHLLSDLSGPAGEAELLVIGERLFGPEKARRWLEKRGGPLAHYDLTPAMRERALRLGARPLADGQMRVILRAKATVRAQAAAQAQEEAQA